MSVLAFALLLSSPSAEQVRLGVELARLNSVASMLPAIELEQTDQLLDEHPELGTRERLALRRLAHRVAVDGMERLIQAEGRAYAEALGKDELKSLIAFAQSSVGRRLRAAEPVVARKTLLAMRGYRYKREVMAALCTETGKGCESQALAAGPEMVCTPESLATTLALRSDGH